MEEDVKRYHFVKQYRQNIALDEKERMRIIRENIQRKFIELKNKTEKNKQNSILPEFEMAEEIIQICTSRYGENLERLEYANAKKVEEVYRALTNFNNALDQEIKKINGNTDKSIE